MKYLLYLLQDAIVKKWKLLEFILKKNCGRQIITLVTDLNKISYLRTQDPSAGQSGFTQLIPYSFYNNFYNYLINIYIIKINIILFIPKSQVPKDRKVTHGIIFCDIKTQKYETHRTRLTVGGNLIDYPGEVTTPTSDITTAKTLINSIISTPNDIFLCADISNIYLDTSMDHYEYM